MTISRKDFIKSASVLTGGMFLGFKNFASIISQDKMGSFRQLRDNVGIYTERGGTMGWYFSNNISAVIDSQFPDTAENFMNDFQEKASNKIDFLFNTHHHRDHTSGNIYLKKFTDHIVAHENCPKFQKKQNQGTDNEKQQVYADMLFKNTWQRELGKENVNAIHLGAAHTGGDIIIYFEKANIAHVGDLVFNQIYPYIDLPGGGLIANWIVVLEKAAELYPEDTLFIFGHAADEQLVTGKKEDLYKMRDYLTALLEFVRKETAEEKSLEEIKKAEFIPGFEHIISTREKALEGNLQAAYEELQGKEF